MLIQIKNQDDIILLSLRKTIKTKKLLKGVFEMKKLNSINLEKVNGTYFPCFNKHTWEEYASAGIFVENNWFSKSRFAVRTRDHRLQFIDYNLANSLVELSKLQQKARSLNMAI